MSGRIRTLLPPGGFSNLVGHHMAALDLGLAETKEAARRAGDRARPALREYGGIESAWVHAALGGVPTPAAPEDAAPLEAWLGWLDAVRTVTQMVLRPLQDRDLERLVRLPGDAAGEGARTVRRLLAELLFRQGVICGRIPV
jgi:hypothetical protein